MPSERLLRKIRTSLAERVDAATVAALESVFVGVVDEEVRLERQRCVDICEARAELWTNTSGAKSSIAAAREEARARANEATCLADLIAQGNSELRVVN
jgi:hypothetical protein